MGQDSSRQSERCLITGANRGIGFELVRQLLERGNRVFAGMRNLQRAAVFDALPATHKSRLNVLQLDVADATQIAACKEEVARQTAGLDLLINNAGINYDSPEAGGPGSHRSISDLAMDNILAMFRVNVVGPMMMAKAFLPLLEGGERPRIVNISSKMGSLALKDDSQPEYTYSATKAALNMLTRALAFEVRNRRVTVIAMNPGWVATDMGGRRAPLQPGESVAGILRVLHSLSISDTGRFLDWTGKDVPW